MTKFILASLLCLAITACGGGGGDVTPPVTQQAACVPKTVRIQLFGDSTMYGYDSFTQAQAMPSPAQDLQALMDLRFGLGAVVVEVRAVSGTTSAQLLAGTDGLNQPWPQSVHADLVVINHGINDQDPIKGEPIDQYEANLRELVKKSPAPVIFETPNDAPPGNLRYGAYAQRMEDVAASLGLPVADTFNYVHTVPNWETYFNDGAHPGAAMYGLIVKNSLAPVIEAKIVVLRCN